jgi:hypothetical protein
MLVGMGWWRSIVSQRACAGRRKVRGQRARFECLDRRTMLSAAVQASFYVSPAGRDTNPGTLALPFQTLDRARDAVRAIDQHMTGNIDVILRGGTYTLANTLKLDQLDSGTDGFQVIWQAYPNEHPILSGGETITGWTLHDAAKNIWQVPVGSLQTRQLYVNGQRAQLARSTGGLAGTVTLTATGLKTTSTALQHFKRPLDLEFVYVGGANPVTDAWKEQIITANSISGNSSQTVINLHQLRGLPPNPAGKLGLPTYIQNAYELLTQPGQWYLDHSARMLYYIPRPGENMKTATVVAPKLQTLLQATGTLSAPIHNIQFSGLSFEYGSWLGPTTSRGFVDAQANWGAQGQRLPANVVFYAAHKIDFEQNLFTHLGGAGLDLYGGSQDNTVNGNLFTDISGSGIQLGDVINPNPSDIRLEDTGNRITNNLISNVANQYQGGVGIFAGYVANTVISHNDVSDLPYTGISIGWGWSKTPANDMVNNQVTDNNVHTVMQLLTDGGGIYTNGLESNMIIQGNYVHDSAQHAIYEDEGSAFIDTSNNVVTHVADWLWIWNPDIHDLTVHDNYTDTTVFLNNGTNTAVTATTVFNDKTWPAAALAIVNQAGILPDVTVPPVK